MKNPRLSPGVFIGDARETGCEPVNTLRVIVRQRVTYIRGENGGVGMVLEPKVDPKAVTAFLAQSTQEMAKWLGTTPRSARRYRSARWNPRRLQQAVRKWMVGVDFQ